MRDIIGFEEFVNEVKAGRAWEGRLKRIDKLLAWMYSRGILSKRDQNKKDSLFRQYYRYYNDGDFPAVVGKEYTKSAPKSAIEDTLERNLEEFIKDILSRYAGKYDRQEFRLDMTVKDITELKEVVDEMDAYGLLSYWAKSIGPRDDAFSKLLAELQPAYDALRSAVDAKDASLNNTTVRYARTKMQDAGTWDRELTAKYAEVAAIMAKIGVVLDDVLHAAQQAKALLSREALTA